MARQASLSLDLLKTFVALIENDGNASKTATELDIKQPSMSKRLRYLQHRGIVLKRQPWLFREGKTWKLTAEGQYALPAVKELINRHQRLLDFTETDRPELAIACGRHAVLGFVKDALQQFRRSHPKALVRISTLRGADRIARVASGSLDMAVVDNDESDIQRIAHRKLHIEKVAESHLGLVCASKSKWAKDLEKMAKTKLDPGAFSKFPLILPEPDAGIRNMLDSFFRQQGLAGKLDVRLEIGGWGTILKYVQGRYGVGLISESAVPPSQDLVVRYFDSEILPVSETKIICRHRIDSEERDLSDIAAKFHDLLCGAIQH